jgi:CRP/FNR family transcriptional regulator
VKRTRPTRTSCDCAACALRAGAFATGLEPSDLRQLQRARSTHAYQRGHYLFYEGNPCTGVFCVQTGVVKLAKSAPQGHRCTLALAGPGDLVGLDALLSGAVHGYGAVMLSEGIVCQIESAAMLRLLEAKRSFQRTALHALAAGLQQSHGEIARLAAGNVRERTAHTLLMLASRFGERVSGRTRVTLELAREEIAEMIGIAAETAIRQLSELRRRGIVSSEGRRLVVEDMDRLSRIARPSAPDAS